MRRFSHVDLVLVLLIAGSLGFIAYRLTSHKKTSEKTVAVIRFAPNANVTKSPEQAKQDNRPEALNQKYGKVYGLRIQRLASSHWQMDAAEWQRALTSSELKSKTVNETEACRKNAAPLPAVYVIAPELRKNFEANRAEIVFDIGSGRCLKVGQSIDVIYMNLAVPGDDLDKPFLEYAGSAQVEGLVQLNRSSSTEGLLRVLGETRHFLESEFFVGVENPKIPYTLVRIGARVKPAAPPKMVHFFPRTKILSKDNFKTALDGSESYIIIDVRSPAEVSAKPLPESLAKHTRNVPFLLEKNSSKPVSFDWNMTLKQIQSGSFDVGLLLGAAGVSRQTMMVFVGASPVDARPLLGIKESFEVGLENIAWYVDGADVVPSGIQ